MSVYFIGATSSGEAFMTVVLKLTTSASCGGGSCSCNREAVALDNCCCSGPMDTMSSSGGCCSSDSLLDLIVDDRSSGCAVEVPVEEEVCCSSESEAEDAVTEGQMSRQPCDGGGESADQRFLAKHILLRTNLVHYHVPFFENQYDRIYSFSFQDFNDSESPIPIA